MANDNFGDEDRKSAKVHIEYQILPRPANTASLASCLPYNDNQEYVAANIN